VPDLIVKIGGSLLAHVRILDEVLAAVAHVASMRPLLIVPGGGQFADAVRDVDRRIGIDDTAAHWMAVLAMDQYAHLLAARLPAGQVVMTLADTTIALAGRRVPVLAPFRWLSEADPLPHSWDVTSDSIAAWIAGAAHARELMLVKAPGAGGAALVDDYFRTVLPPHVAARAIPADQAAAVLDRIAGIMKPQVDTA
jgi:5-(aminomethyl)-3-furanmethanol phosphate kinase